MTSESGSNILIKREAKTFKKETQKTSNRQSPYLQILPIDIVEERRSLEIHTSQEKTENTGKIQIIFW